MTYREAADRVGEFLRQRSRMLHLDQDDIAGVHSDPNADVATLTVDDLTSLASAVNALERAQMRLDNVEFIHADCDRRRTRDNTYLVGELRKARRHIDYLHTHLRSLHERTGAALRDGDRTISEMPDWTDPEVEP